MKSPEEHDPVWKLLLKSKSQQPSAFFVRNVVREARKLGAESQESGWAACFAWLKRPVVAVPVAAGAAAVLITALTFIQALTPPSSNVNIALVEAVDGQTPTISAEPSSGGIAAPASDPASEITDDLERIDYMGELVAVSDPGELDDDALADLLALR